MQDITHHYSSDAILLVDTAVDALLSLAHHGSDLSRRRVMTEYTIPSSDMNHCNGISSSHCTTPFVKINLKKRKNSFMDVNSHRTTSTTNSSTSSLHHHHPGSKASFPMEIFHVLNQKEVEHIVSWTPDGTSFVIHNMQIFQSYILPHYFNGIKFDSFQRKLYRWGFTKNLSYKLKGGEYDIDDPLSSSAVSTSRKTNAVIWSNALFQRNKPHLCHEMTCATGTTSSSSHTSPTATTTTTTITTTSATPTTTSAYSVHREDHHHKKRRNKHHYSHGKHGIVTATTSSSGRSSSHGDGSTIIGATTTSSSWQQPQ